MKSSVFAIIVSAVCVTAYKSCGYTLVNNNGYTQKELAEHHCGRSDTCNGEEWNTVFEIELMSEGPSSWIEINSRGFCSTGCYEGASGAACH